MKKSLLQLLLTTLFCLFFSAQELQAQKQNWRWQNPLPQGNTLRGSATPDSNTVFMVGDAGTILRSKDKGQNWENLKTNLRADLYAVSFFGPNYGLAVGEDGTILRTYDCGKTWEKLISGRNDTLRDISLLNGKIAIAVGDTGTILRSPDQGDTWIYNPISGFNPNLNGVFFPAPDFGMIYGDSLPPFGNPPVVFSGDSGVSYNPFPGPASFANNSFNGGFMPKADPNKAVLVGDEGLIINTHDGGLNWTAPVSGTTVDIADVWFFDDQNGFATGPNGILLRTKNCGDSWSVVNLPTQGDLLTVRFPDSLHGYLGGNNGGLFRTDDGAQTFTNISSGFRPFLTDVTFLDDSFGIAVGGQGAILRTPDAGETWSPVSTGNSWDWESVTTTERDSFGRPLWVAGGVFGDSARIMFSPDTGKTWAPQPIPSPVKLFDITFSDSLNGFAVGLNGQIYCTKNGGKSWQPKFSGTFNWLLDVSMPNDTTAYVSGGFGTLLCTRNGGTTFTPLSSGTNEWLTSVSFVDDSFGIATGNHGVVLRTTDAGDNWQDVSPPGFEKIDFTQLSLFRNDRTSNKTTGSGDVGVTIVGYQGSILYSPDGGDTWEVQNSRTKHHLTGCFFTDSITGTAVGAEGTILRTDGRVDTTATVGLEELVDSQVGGAIILEQNFPNPVIDRTVIPFSLPKTSYIRLSILDLNGREVVRLVEDKLAAGSYQYEWQADGLAAGVYIYQLEVNGEKMSKKMWLLTD